MAKDKQQIEAKTEEPKAEAKPDEKVRVRLHARFRVGETQHKAYWAAGVRLELVPPGQPLSWVEVAVTPLELSWLRADQFIVVHDDLTAPEPAVPIINQYTQKVVPTETKGNDTPADQRTQPARFNEVRLNNR